MNENERVAALEQANIEANVQRAELKASVTNLQIQVADNTSLTESIGMEVKNVTTRVANVETGMTEMLDIFNSWKGAFRTIEMIGKLFKPITGIILFFTAVWGAIAAVKGGILPK